MEVGLESSSDSGIPSHLITRWTEIVIRVCGETPDPTTRFHLMAEALRLELNSVAGFMTLSKISGGPETLDMRRLAGFGEWAPADRAARDEYHLDINRYPDPFVSQYILHGCHKKRSAVLRQELVSDEDWYSSPHYKHLRLKAKQDSCFYITMPAVDPRGVILEDGLIWTINYNRSTGSPQFTAQERDFAAACFFGLSDLLYDVWRTPETPQDVILTSLPIRLRKVAGCLLAGDTEKQAAQKLGLSAHTVHGYIKDLYKAFGVNSRPELLIRLLQEDQEELVIP